MGAQLSYLDNGRCHLTGPSQVETDKMCGQATGDAQAWTRQCLHEGGTREARDGPGRPTSGTTAARRLIGPEFAVLLIPQHLSSLPTTSPT